MPDNDDFFDELEAEAKDAPPPPAASLDAVHAMGMQAVELQRRIETGEALLSELKAARYNLLSKEMPAMMDELRVPFVGVDNYRLDCVTHYKANIAADDPEEKREQAFEWLESAGGGDVISMTVTVAFPKELHEDAVQLAEELKRRFDNRKSEVEIRVEKKVPWNRLTSWLREFVTTPPKKGETKLAVPLELLNASIGRLVKIKEV